MRMLHICMFAFLSKCASNGDILIVFVCIYVVGILWTYGYHAFRLDCDLAVSLIHANLLFP